MSEKQCISSNIIFYCQKHSKNQISHICCLEDCLSELCAKCIKEHNQIHKEQNTFPELEGIDEVKEFCNEKLEFLSKNFQTEYRRISDLNFNELAKNDDGITKIKKYHDLIMEYVNTYFSRLISEYEACVNKFEKQEKLDFTSHKKIISNVIEEINQIQKNYYKNPSIENLKNILIADYSDSLEQIKNEINQKIDNFILNKAKVVLDSNVLANFQYELSKLIKLRKTDESRIIPYDDIKIQSQHNIFGGSKTTRSASPFQSKRANEVDASIFKNVEEKSKDFNIKLSSFFTSLQNPKYLHFFQQKSDSLHLFDLEDLSKNVLKPLKLTLQINFKIPRWHRSICIPNGNIYLTGGVMNSEIKTLTYTNQEKTSNEVFLLEVDKNRFSRVAQMKNARSGHGIVYMNNKIYVIGGLTDESNYSNICEKYNIESNTWDEIAKLNYKVNNCCVCSYNNQYLYKFGGKSGDRELNAFIERYNPSSNKWSIIDINLFENNMKNDFMLLSSSACCQINKNQIFIFGGTMDSYSKKSKQSFLLEVNFDREGKEIHIAKGFNKFDLPIAEGFWNNVPIIFEGSLYALQNVPNENNLNIVYNDRRKILRFNEKEGWVCLN